MQSGRNTLSVTDQVCDFCGFNNLQPVYVVPGSLRMSVVHLCPGCGLTQSKQPQREDHTSRLIANSCEADWGNIRHGKGIRLDPAINVLSGQVDWSSVLTLTDIGSNRGKFIHWVAQNHPHVRITAIEPDNTIAGDYPPGITLLPVKFENTFLPGDSQDMVFNCHTLEHADSASSMVREMNRILKPGGNLFLDVPNILVIEDPSQVEEFFIDKHVYHFHPKILRNFLESAGFDIVYESPAYDHFNIIYLCRKTNKTIPFTGLEKGEIDRVRTEIQNYSRRLGTNRSSLKSIAQTLQSFMSRQKVAVWGAGKLLDALVRYGKLNVSALPFVIDDHLWGILSETHGVRITTSGVLRQYHADVVVVLARSSTGEIVRKARRLGIINIITYEDLCSGITRYQHA